MALLFDYPDKMSLQGLIDYFDLNKRARNAGVIFVSNSKLIGTNKRGKYAVKFTPKRQILMYFGVFVGVIFSKIINYEESLLSAPLENMLCEVLLSSFIALMIIPYVYEKATINPSSPLLVQFGLFVQNGFFWQAIIRILSKQV